MAKVLDDNSKEKFPVDFTEPKLLNISADEMIQIWNNIEDATKALGFNRWGLAKVIKVRRQTLDRWIRVGTIPDINVIYNISKILDLPLSVILNPSVSCIKFLEDKKSIHINVLKKELIGKTNNESINISRYWNSKDKEVAEDTSKILILPAECFPKGINVNKLFWWDPEMESGLKEIIIFYKKEYYFKNGYYLIKRWNHTTATYNLSSVSLKFEPEKQYVTVVYKDQHSENVPLTDSEEILILGEIVKRIID